MLLTQVVYVLSLTAGGGGMGTSAPVVASGLSVTALAPPGRSILGFGSQ